MTFMSNSTTPRTFEATFADGTTVRRTSSIDYKFASKSWDGQTRFHQAARSAYATAEVVETTVIEGVSSRMAAVEIFADAKALNMATARITEARDASGIHVLDESVDSFDLVDVRTFTVTWDEHNTTRVTHRADFAVRDGRAV